MLNATQIARICHEATLRYNEDANLPSLLPWGAASTAQRASVIDGVMNIITHPDTTPESNHENWLEHKLAAGWTYGPEKDEAKKTHPCLVPYGDLPEAQRTKDVLFVNIVRALMPPPPGAPAAEQREPISLFNGDPERLRAFAALRQTSGYGDSGQSSSKETDNGEAVHAEDGGGVAAQADRDGGEAAGGEETGAQEQAVDPNPAAKTEDSSDEA